jgi:hypothetical protein
LSDAAMALNLLWMAAVWVTVIPTMRSETPLVIPLHADHVHWGYFGKNETPIATIYSGQGAFAKQVEPGQEYPVGRFGCCRTCLACIDLHKNTYKAHINIR